MLLAVVPDALIGTNCYVLAPAAGEECQADAITATVDQLKRAVG